MSWPATSRYQLDAAPGSLAFVQDFVNTIPAGKPRGPDLLADLPDAQRWLDEALAQWRHTRGVTADDVVLNEADLVELRAIRAGLVSRIRAGTTDPAAPDDDHLALSAATTMQLDAHGRVHAVPNGTGWRYVASALLIEIYDAQRDGAWRHLKTCCNHRCSAAFFDRSRNNSRVWHDVTVCGNLANLHAHRARKRAEHNTPGRHAP
jgi:predicted RNA-binding Zn ribbon-like protein